jgi:hypothetical protein
MLGFLIGLAFQSLSWIWILEELLTFKSGNLGGWLLELGNFGSCKVFLCNVFVGHSGAIYNIRPSITTKL